MPVPPFRPPPTYIITMHIFFRQLGFGLSPCICVKVLLRFVFLFHVCGVFGVIVCEGLFFFERGGVVRG